MNRFFCICFFLSSLAGCNLVTGVNDYENGTDSASSRNSDTGTSTSSETPTDNTSSTDSDSDSGSDTSGTGDTDTDTDTGNCDNRFENCFGPDQCSACAEAVGMPCETSESTCTNNSACKALRDCGREYYEYRTANDLLSSSAFAECVGNSTFEGFVLFRTSFVCVICNSCQDTCNSDEFLGDSCLTLSQCDATTHFDCRDGSAAPCIAIENFCDVEVDCDNGLDEALCEQPMAGCNFDIGEYPCGNGQCFSAEQKCDGIADCGTTDADEQHCPNGS